MLGGHGFSSVPCTAAPKVPQAEGVIWDSRIYPHMALLAIYGQLLIWVLETLRIP